MRVGNLVCKYSTAVKLAHLELKQVSIIFHTNLIGSIELERSVRTIFYEQTLFICIDIYVAELRLGKENSATCTCFFVFFLMLFPHTIYRLFHILLKKHIYFG